jgi:hypothetical protein
VLHRHGATSHRRYRAVIDGQIYFVDVLARMGVPRGILSASYLLKNRR